MSERDESRIKDLRDRVIKFGQFELPGQPMGLHMGTAYLIADLMSMVEDLAKSAPPPTGSETERE